MTAATVQMAKALAQMMAMSEGTISAGISANW
jgi:hypothetical protein